MEESIQDGLVRSKKCEPWNCDGRNYFRQIFERPGEIVSFRVDVPDVTSFDLRLAKRSGESASEMTMVFLWDNLFSFPLQRILLRNAEKVNTEIYSE